MPAEIGLTDGTRIQVDQTPREVVDSIEAVREESRASGGGPRAPARVYGEWWKPAASEAYLNPAHIVYVRDVAPSSEPFAVEITPR